MEQPRNNNFVTRFISEYRIYPRPLYHAESAIKLHLDKSADSKMAYQSFVSAEQRFEPIIAEGDAPFVDFGGKRYKGLKGCLGMVKGAVAFDKSMRDSLERMGPSRQSDERTTDGSKKIVLDTKLSWAFAEAIVEGRSFSSLDSAYQLRDRSRNASSWEAIGHAEAHLHPYTLLNNPGSEISEKNAASWMIVRTLLKDFDPSQNNDNISSSWLAVATLIHDLDRSQNLEQNTDESNLASWQAIDEADTEKRPYYEVMFGYHRQMLTYDWYKKIIQHGDAANMRSWMAISEANLENRPYSEVKS